MGRCNVFHHIFENEKKSELYGPNFQTMLFLVTMVQVIKICLKPPFFKWAVTTDATNDNINDHILIDRLTFWVHVVKIKSESL